MAKRLVKVAKELNVGTQTIVEFLANSGFEIENKPTAKITPEMEDELLKEFQKSIAIKEKADQLVIGTRPAAKKEEEGRTKPPESVTTVIARPEEKPEAKKPPKEEPKIEEPPAQKPEPEPEVEAKKEKEKEKEAAPEEEEKPKVGLKIKGKIDLEKDKPKAKKKTTKEEKEEEEPKKKEEPKVVEEPAAKEEKPAEEEEAKKETTKQTTTKKEEEEPEVAEDKEEPKESSPEPAEAEGEAGPGVVQPKSDETIRAQTPELRGLKILGKIDIEARKPKKKKKETPKEEVKAKKKPEKVEDDPNKRKRKRTRRRVPTSSISSGAKGKSRKGGTRKGRDEEVKEVSQKEIDEQIKATMARLAGGSKKKRQKLRRDSRERQRERQEQLEQAEQSGKLQLTEFISVQDLANLLNVNATDVITTCMNLGVIVSINQRLDAEIIELVAEEFGKEVEFINVEDQVEEEEEIVDDPEDLEPRAPIVTVMGHVDHGKTSLLDYIREADVAGGEAGGITQHVGAYEVQVSEEKRKITFLDTPGHEAFTAMRARGAKVTDIAVIIIAADDNVMPQTKEAISHAQAAGVPMVFAINKVDKAGAQPDRIKQELSGMNLLVEEWGGEYQSQDISAKTGLGVAELLEKILLVADLLELQANPDRKAIGTILEASLDKGRGYVTKMLVQTGTLEIGDPVVAGEHSGKIKAMFNERGKRVKKVGPSSPILVLGLDGAPQAGERFKEMDTEQEARQIASKRAQIQREQANRASKRISLDEIGRRLALGNFKELNLIVKGDVDGSIEALSDSLIKLTQETVQVNVIHKAVGQIIESDVLLASASDAIIIGFQVRPSMGARKLAEKEGVQIKTYSIIYQAIEEVKAAIEGMLEPTREENIIGNVEVREVYKISKVGTVAGCFVTDGKINRNSSIRLIRDGIVVYPSKEGKSAELASLKRFKDDAKEVKAGMECGLTIKNFNDIKVGDVVEVYEITEVKQRLA